jgi:hypothetical protein
MGELSSGTTRGVVRAGGWGGEDVGEGEGEGGHGRNGRGMARETGVGRGASWVVVDVSCDGALGRGERGGRARRNGMGNGKE